METPMFVHVITLAFGLMIAFGLQRIVAFAQRRKREQQATVSPAEETTRAPRPPPRRA